MLKHKRLQAESKLLNKNVIKLSAWKEITEIIRFIPEEPSYVYCELDATDLVSIHALEEAGFRFSEFRVSSILKTDDSEISIRPFYPFVAEIITEKTQIQLRRPNPARSIRRRQILHRPPHREGIRQKTCDRKPQKILQILAQRIPPRHLQQPH